MLSTPRFRQAQRQAKYNNHRAHKKGIPGTLVWYAVYDKGIAQCWRCFYCGCSIWERYTIDHVIPLSKGGSNKVKNIVLACESCNHEKGDRLLDSSIMVRKGGDQADKENQN